MTLLQGVSFILGFSAVCPCKSYDTHKSPTAPFVISPSLTNLFQEPTQILEKCHAYSHWVMNNAHFCHNTGSL